MSKSEILNLSVLECLSVGTKSIVSTDIEYPKNYPLIVLQNQIKVIYQKNLSLIFKQKTKFK